MLSETIENLKDLCQEEFEKDNPDFVYLTTLASALQELMRRDSNKSNKKIVINNYEYTEDESNE